MSGKVRGVLLWPCVYVWVHMQSALLHLPNPLCCNRKQILDKLLVTRSLVFENAGFSNCCSCALHFCCSGKHYHAGSELLEGMLGSILLSCKQICQ